MNRYPIGKPPKWWSPRPSRFWMRFWRRRRRRILRQHENVASVQVQGLDHLRAAINAGQGILIVANHPTHADWLTIYEALDQLRRPCYVMTTWQVFQMAGPIVRMQYRQHGCFSIDRDGADRQAFRCSVEILAETSDPLVIFPEGEVYHTSDRVATFREGPATIAQAAVKKSGRPVACIPCALRYKYSRSPLPELLDVMDRVEQKLELPRDVSLDLIERIYRAGGAATAQLELEHLGESRSTQPLRDRLPQLVNAMLGELDERYGVRTERWSPPERVKQLRQKVIGKRDALIAEERPLKEKAGAAKRHAAGGTENKSPMPARTQEQSQELQQIDRDFEKLFQALQIFSYPSGYLRANPTLERIAETIDKLEEDVLGAETAGIRGTREATLNFGEPLLIEQPGDRETAVSWTNQMHAQLQAMIDTESPGEPASSLLNMAGG